MHSPQPTIYGYGRNFHLWHFLWPKCLWPKCLGRNVLGRNCPRSKCPTFQQTIKVTASKKNKQTMMSLPFVLYQVVSCDPIAEHPLPVSSWGTHFIVPPLPPRKGYFVRIFSQQMSVVHYYNTTRHGTALTNKYTSVDLMLGNMLGMRGSRKFCQRGSNFDDFFFLMRDGWIQIAL